MAAITSIQLSHFRSHALTRLEPAAASVVLFGPNGAGKTNVLEAVSMLSPGRGLRRAAAADMARRPNAIGWKVTGTVGDHHLETWAEHCGNRQVRIDDKAATATALGRHLSVVWLTPAMDRLWTEGAEGRRRFLDRLTLSFFSDHGDLTLTYDKAMRERNRLLKDQVADPHWYAALETQMGEAGARIEANRDAAVDRLAVAQQDATSQFPKAGLTLEGPDGMPRLTDPGALTDSFAASRQADLRAGRTLVGPHRADLLATYTDKGVNAREASTGEQKALLISLVLANARALKTENRPPLILLDEVSAHLDKGRRAALFEEIDALGVQAWMTGTGPELFEAVAPSVQKYEVRDDGEGSLVSAI